MLSREHKLVNVENDLVGLLLVGLYDLGTARVLLVFLLLVNLSQRDDFLVEGYVGILKLIH